MYKCKDCGSVFEDEEAVKKQYWEGSDDCGHYVNYYVCPECGSDEIAEAKECHKCGLYEIEEEMEEELCLYCQRQAMQKWDVFRLELTEEELEYIRYEI